MTDRVAFLGHSDWDVAGILGEPVPVSWVFLSARGAAHDGRPGLPAPGTFDLLVVMGSVRPRSRTPRSGGSASERTLVGRAVARRGPGPGRLLSVASCWPRYWVGRWTGPPRPRSAGAWWKTPR